MLGLSHHPIRLFSPADGRGCGCVGFIAIAVTLYEVVSWGHIPQPRSRRRDVIKGRVLTYGTSREEKNSRFAAFSLHLLSGPSRSSFWPEQGQFVLLFYGQ